MDTTVLKALYQDHITELSARYSRTLAASGFDAVVIHSGSQTMRSEFDDQYYRLRVTPHFEHWLPLAEAEHALVIRQGGRPTLLRLANTSYWERPEVPETDHFYDSFEIKDVTTVAALAELLPKGHTAVIAEARAKLEGWGVASEARNPKELVQALDQHRTTKTAYEIACLAEANRRAALGHEALRSAFATGADIELDLHLLYLKMTRQDDAETPYKGIVALGRNAATLHHITYGKRATGRKADSLLVDAGACYQGYGSDITRTWVRGDGASVSAFAGLLAAMEAMQQRLCQAITVGEPYEKLHDRAHTELAEILVNAGIVRGSASEALEKGVTRAFFPHGLGHSLGLQTHDVGCALLKPRADNPFLRNTTVVAPGQVFTIEPGLYFIDGLLGPLRAGEHGNLIDWNVVEALAPLGGIRIEDDLVVRDVGGENMTRSYLPLGGAPL